MMAEHITLDALMQSSGIPPCKYRTCEHGNGARSGGKN